MGLCSLLYVALCCSLMDDTLQDVPDGRSWHTFKFVSENKAVVYGGFNSSEQVLSKALDFYLLFSMSNLL